MTRKRDLLKEIQAKKGRSEFNLASTKLFCLQLDFAVRIEKEQAFNSDPGLYVVGIVACIEVAVREAIRRLIDHGRPYVERMPEFKDVLHLDFNIAIALHDKRISFGDLVSHLLPVSNVEQINSHFEILFGRKFKEVLAGVREFVGPSDTELLGTAEEEPPTDLEPEPEEVEPTLLPIPDVDALIASLGRLFRARHNAAHEADFNSVTNDELREFFRTGETLIHALDEIVSQTLEPNIPRSAVGQSYLAVIEAGQVGAEVDALYKKATALATDERGAFVDLDMPTQAAALRDAQEAFEKYFDAEMTARGVFSSRLSGNGMRMRDAHVQKELWGHRIQMLSELVSDLEFEAEISSLTEG